MRHSRIPLQRLPYTTILAATCGDAMAMADVLKHYGRYINKLATRVLYDGTGNAYSLVDETLKARLELKLVMGVLSFDAAQHQQPGRNIRPGTLPQKLPSK